MRALSTVVVSLFLLLTASAQTEQESQNTPPIRITRAGSQPAQKGPADRFTGSVRVEPLFGVNAPSRTSGGSVTFEPGARSAWHSHPLGQTLIVTAGTGRVQRWGGPMEEMRKGDVVQIPAGVKHWHGATPASAMTHIAIQEERDGANVTWMEKVSDEQYGTTTLKKEKQMKEPSAAQKIIGDFSPKMVELTDNVLFGDIWERPELSKRDRSLVTVTALIAGGHTEQLPGHLQRAKENGVTEPEIVEVITHLAFYSGWPRAMSAIRVAKEVFQK
jgi:4-carboxymuconolactone decarboxylase